VQLRESYQLFQEGAEALSFVEQQGISIDVPYCLERLDWVKRKTDQSEARLQRSALGLAWIKRFAEKARWASTPQLRAVLYADLGAKPFKQSEKGEDSVDEESLRQTGVDGIDHLLQMRRLKKAKDVLGQFVKYQLDGKLYPSFSLHTVATYRSSSQNPNFQNVPKRDKEMMDLCRAAIKPSPGNILVEVDFSGLEVSIAACYHKDSVMMHYLNDPNSDMHADTAVEIFKVPRANDIKSLPGFGTLRQAAKNGFVFPQFYGDFYESCAFIMATTWCKLPHRADWRGTDGVAFNGAPIGQHMRSVGFDALSDFTEHVKRVEDNFWNKRFGQYNRWRKDWYARYQKQGGFTMKTGFRCSGVMAKNQVINYPVQGAAFHCLLWTLIQLVEALRGWRSKVIAEIHDSVIMDVHPDEFDAVVELAHRIATQDLQHLWDWIIVPLRIEVSAAGVDEPWSKIQPIT
jgi:DNA polymerase I-like protein with 3'-5' exonuclease and polymerase domains